jgi:signal transduction histidine kinase
MPSSERSGPVAESRLWLRRGLRSISPSLGSGHTHTVATYVVSVLTVILATFLRLGLDPVLGEHHPFTLYFAAVAIASWYGGLGPGAVAIVLSYFAADWFFITPRFEFNWPHENLDEFLALLAFLFSGFAIAITSNIMRRALRQARQKQRELEREVAERRRAEEALQQAQVQLRQHADLLEQRVAERTAYLQETIHSLEGVCYHIAHDLRAPLRAMDGYTTLLLRECIASLDGTGQHYAHEIARAAQRMDLLIHGLLEYGRLGHEDFAIKPVQLNDVVTRLVSQFAAEVSSQGAEVELGDWWPEILGNESLLELALLNLMSNALKFVRSGVPPRIRIWMENRAPSIRLWIEDNGIGIPEEYVHKAFGIFERLHPAQKYPGTGIGLAIAAKAVERMKGRLGVESKVNAGTRFWLELPAVVPGETLEVSRFPKGDRKKLAVA